MSAAFKISAQDPLQLNQQLVAWCEDAVIETFVSILGVTPRLTDVVYNPRSKFSQEISGVMGFVQTRMEGTLALGFSQQTIQKIMSGFYQQEINSINERLIGGVCEMTNIVFGLVKQHYADSGHQFQMCLPVVVVGTNHTIFSAFKSERLMMHFQTDHGPFWLEIMSVQTKPEVKEQHEDDSV